MNDTYFYSEEEVVSSEPCFRKIAPMASAWIANESLCHGSKQHLGRVLDCLLKDMFSFFHF